MLGGTVSSAVSTGFATARAVGEAYAAEYLEIYSDELRYAKLGGVVLIGATAYTLAVVTTYCTGELLGLPRGWIGLGAYHITRLAVSRAALATYALVGGAYAAAGASFGYDALNRKIKLKMKGYLSQFMDQSALEEKPVFAVVKSGKVWHEAYGGGPTEGPTELPGVSESTEAAFELNGTVYTITKEGQLNKPMMATHHPGPGEIWGMMDWSAQACYVHQDRLYLIKNGQVWHESLAGGDLKGPEQWSLVDENVQGAMVMDGRFWVVKGGRVYHEKIGGKQQMGPEKWDIMDDNVQDFFTARGRLYVIKNGELWHEQLGGGDLVGPEKRSYIDWAVQACWAHSGRAYFIRGGQVEHFALPELQGKSLPLHPTPINLHSIQAAWAHGKWVFLVNNGEIYKQEIGGGGRQGPHKWDLIDESVQAAYLEGGRLWVFKAGKVYHANADANGPSGSVVGPESWPLVDESVQAALVTTDHRLGVAKYTTTLGMPIYALNEVQTGRVLADIILEETRSLELAQQMASASNAKHVNGTMLAKCSVMDLCQDFGMTPTTATAVRKKLRHFVTNGVPAGILTGEQSRSKSGS